MESVYNFIFISVIKFQRFYQNVRDHVNDHLDCIITYLGLILLSSSLIYFKIAEPDEQHIRASVLIKLVGLISAFILTLVEYLNLRFSERFLRTCYYVGSFLICETCTFLSLFFVYMLPNRKNDMWLFYIELASIIAYISVSMVNILMNLLLIHYSIHQQPEQTLRFIFIVLNKICHYICSICLYAEMFIFVVTLSDHLLIDWILNVQILFLYILCIECAFLDVPQIIYNPDDRSIHELIIGMKAGITLIMHLNYWDGYSNHRLVIETKSQMKDYIDLSTFMWIHTLSLVRQYCLLKRAHRTIFRYINTTNAIAA